VARNADQLIVIRRVTGFGLGFALSAAFPIAGELMPEQHRRAFGAIYEVILAGAPHAAPFRRLYGGRANTDPRLPGSRSRASSA